MTAFYDTYQVSGKSFCAGLVRRNGEVVDCAPILRRYWKYSKERFENLCRVKHWKVELVESREEEEESPVFREKEHRAKIAAWTRGKSRVS
jgi:hypothetical protein